MFTRLQHVLRKVRGRRVPISTAVYDELITWRQLVHELADHSTHLRELDPPPLTWEGATDASGAGMDGVCQDPKGQWFVWRSPVSVATHALLVKDTNPTGDVTINDLDIAALFDQVQLFAPKIPP